MKTKLEVAHEWYLKHAGGAKSHMDLEVDLAWKYADAMQAESDKREVKGVPEAILKASNSRELEWQPDWSQAPEGATEWRMLYADVFKWIIPIPFGEAAVDAPSFNYQGDWQDSLRKRP